MENKLIPVVLLKKYQQYNPGEVAGFPKKIVDKLISQRLAKLWTKDGQKVEQVAEVAQPVAEAEQPKVEQPKQRRVVRRRKKVEAE